MESALVRIFSGLNTAGAEYLVVGDVAVVLHGHPRFTADLDLVVGLTPDNALRAVVALENLGFRPRVPVAIRDFADPATRRSWIDDKGLTVFSLWNPSNAALSIDLFVDEPLPFAPAHARALRADVGGTVVTVVSLEDLIAMKERVGRDKDRDDVRALRAIAAEALDE